MATILSGRKVISERENYALLAPASVYDTNYHLLDRNTGEVWLIDIEDALELNEEGKWDEIRTLKNIDYAKEMAWKKPTSHATTT